MDPTVLQHILLQLEEQRSAIVQSISSGRLSHEEYKRLCGSLEGLDHAVSVLKHTAKQLESDDE